MPFLTGESSAGSCEATIVLPDDRFLRAALAGQIAALTEQWNWEEFGALSVEEVTSIFQDVYDNLTWDCGGLLTIMLVYTGRDTNVSLSTNTWQKLTGLTQVIYNTGEWDAANDRVNIAEDGLYAVNMFAAQGGAGRGLQIGAFVNGSAARYSGHLPDSAEGLQVSPTWLLPLNNGDTLDMWVYLTQAAILYTNAGLSGMLVYRLGDLA